MVIYVYVSCANRLVSVKMASFTVTFTGTTSELETTFFPPLLLSSEWEICLLDLTTYNSIANIVEGVNNVFTYCVSGEQTPRTVKLPTGSYEIDDINKYLQASLGGAEKITLRANNNTLKCELKCVHDICIDYKQQANIASLLGFKPTGSLSTRTLEANKWHVSNETVDIVKVNVIQVKCNIVHGSFKDGIEDHILHTFYPLIAPGFKIVEKPHNLIYLPVNVNRVDTLRIRIVDENDDIIDFRGEVITVRVHLKKQNV